MSPQGRSELDARQNKDYRTELSLQKESSELFCVFGDI